MRRCGKEVKSSLISVQVRYRPEQLRNKDRELNYILGALGVIILVAGLRLMFTRLRDDRSESQWWDEQR